MMYLHVGEIRFSKYTAANVAEGKKIDLTIGTFQKDIFNL
jgi:hypothetical protein